MNNVGWFDLYLIVDCIYFSITLDNVDTITIVNVNSYRVINTDVVAFVLEIDHTFLTHTLKYEPFNSCITVLSV